MLAANKAKIIGSGNAFINAYINKAALLKTLNLDSCGQHII